MIRTETAEESAHEGAQARQDVGRHLQYDELAWPCGQDRKQGEANDKAGESAQVAGAKDEQSIPSTHCPSNTHSVSQQHRTQAEARVQEDGHSTVGGVARPEIAQGEEIGVPCALD